MPNFAILRPMKNLPTTEQQAIIDAFATGGNLVIEAGAGTGKTTTLKMLGEAADGRKGLYIAYNKAIATDAGSDFPSNVACSTAHSLAYRACMSHPEHKQLLGKLRTTNRVSPVDASKIMGIPYEGFQTEDGGLKGYQVAGLVMKAIQNFCNSADSEVKERHTPKVDGMEPFQAKLNSFVYRYAVKSWADLTSANGKLKFQHDHYLKVWALTGPKLAADFVLFDEAQDANPVIAAVVEAQAAHGTQLVMVGDRSQAIYGWRGAVDAMTQFTADHRLVLSQSFRFGPAVATKANLLLDYLAAPLRLTGLESLPTTVEPLVEADAILCRTNAEVIGQAIEALEAGKTVAIVGGTGEIKRFAEAAQKLMSGKTTTHPDLVAFKSWGDVREYSLDDDGRDLRVMVKLIDDYGVQTILDVCDDAGSSEDDADVIVSTAHKAKGREWNRVKVASDFRAPDFEAGETLSRPEAMLLYVTITRAKLVLDMSAVAWIEMIQA